MQSHEQEHQGIEQSVHGVGPQGACVHVPIRDRPRQVLGDQHTWEGLTGGVRAPGDDPHPVDGWDLELLEIPQETELALGELRGDLLEGHHRPVDVDETHDVAGDPARQRDDQLIGPPRQRDLPGEVEHVAGDAGLEPDRQVLVRHPGIVS